MDAADRPAGNPAGHPSPVEPGAHDRAATRRAPVGARRFGYLVAIVLNIALLVVVFVWPAWWALPFLTAETTQVLPLIAAQAWIGIAINVIWIVVDPPWLRALGDVVTSAVGLAVAWAVLQVFPFDFGASDVPWETLVLVVVWIAVIGSAIGVIANVVKLAKALAARQP